jgi:hypothetical protein
VQIACVLQNKTVDPRDFAFRVAAANLQMVRDFWPAWRGNLPGDPSDPKTQEPWPVVDYAHLDGIDTAGFHPIFELADLGDPSMAGVHDDVLDYIYGRDQTPADPLDATTKTHEVLEMRGDPTCNLWVRRPDGLWVAKETCDAVEADAYGITVELDGETRTIQVTNFLLPAYFVADSEGPWDFMKRLDRPFGMTPGGYTITKDDASHVSNEFASAPHTATGMLSRKLLARKLSDRHSRSARRTARAELAR